MGADLIIAIVPAPRFTDGEVVTDFNQIRNQVRHRLRTTTDAKTRASVLKDMYPGDDDPLTKPDDVLERWVDLHEEVTNAYGYRDTTWFECLHGAIYWITGGMSWGDDPTESFQPFNAIGEFSIFTAPFEKEWVEGREPQ